MSEASVPRTVRTLILNWDRGWSDFSVSVRARACDLYPLGEAVEFWSRGPAGQPETILWGEWPRFLEGDPEEIEAELRAEIDELHDFEHACLALIIVAAQPPTNDTTDFAFSKMLQRLAEDGLPRGEAASRLLRVVAFREGAETPECRAAARDLIEAPGLEGSARVRLADAAVFLTPPGLTETARARSGARVFAGLRLLIDLARAEAPRGGPGGGWALLRQTDASERQVLWLQPPAEIVSDPSAILRAQIIEYVRPRQSLTREGKTFHFKAFDTALTSLVTLEPAQQESALEPSHEPADPRAGPRRVAEWIDKEMLAIGQAARQLQADIRERQVQRDGPLRLRERAVADAARSLSLADIGLDDNARSQLQERLDYIQARQQERTTEAAQQRGRLREQFAKLGLAGWGATDAAADIARHAEAGQLREAHHEWLRLALNHVPPATILILYGLSVVGLYGLLLDAVLGEPDSRLSEALFLGTSRNLWALLGVYAVVAALLATYFMHRMERERRTAAALAQNKADGLRRMLRATFKPSIEYAECAAVAGALSPLRRRLARMQRDLEQEARHGDRTATGTGAGTLTAQVTMLELVTPRPPLTDEARQQFANRVGSQLQTEVPLSGWLSRLVAQPLALQDGKVSFDTLGWAGEVQVPSRMTLPPGSTVRIEALPPADPRR